MTIVEDNLKSPYQLATILRYKGERFSIPWRASLALDTYLKCWVLSKEPSRTIVWVFDMTRAWIKPRSPRSFANILPIRPIYKLLANVVQCGQKALFYLASTLRCRGGRYSFPWIPSLYPRYVSYIAEC